MVGRFQEHLQKGRGHLHAEMSVAAVCFDGIEPFVDGVTEVTPVSVRVHDHFHMTGDLAGTNFSYAEHEGNSPRVVFLRSELTPQDGMIVSVSPGLAYRVVTVKPPNGITVTAQCALIREEETVGFPVPEVD